MLRTRALLPVALLLSESMIKVTLAQTAPAPEIGLEEVIITAEKRATSLQKTAVSVTAVDGAQLASQGQSAFNDALRTVPSVAVRDQNGSAQPVVAIRGIQPAFGTDTSVNINVDGVYQNSGVMPIYDLNRLEVLKGPQGTLYGRNALGGVVNMITNDPSNEYGGNVILRFGNYNAARIEAALNLPFSDAVQSRTAVLYSKRDGYLTNGTQDEDVRAVREKLRINITSDLSALLTGEYARVQGHGAGTVPSPLSGHTSYASTPGFTTPGDVLVPVLGIERPSNPWYSETRPGAQDFKRIAGNLQIDWKQPWANLLFLGSYEDVHTLNDNNVQTLAQRNSFAESQNYNAAYEFRVSNADDSRVLWQTGVYYSRQTGRPILFPHVLLPLEQHRASTGASTANLTDGETTSSAAFAQVTVPLTDVLRVTGGLRYTKEKTDRTIEVYNVVYTDTYTAQGYSTGLSTTVPTNHAVGEDSAWTGKLGVEYDLSVDSMLYADYSRGFKAGGLNNPDVPASVAGPTFKPEYLDAYEIGSKNEFFDKRLRLNADAYYYKDKDKQYTLLGACNPAAQYGPSCPIPQTPNVNASSASMYGLEVQSAWLVTNDDRIDANVAWSHTQFDSFLQSTSPGPGLPNGYPLGTFTDPITGHTTPVVPCGGTSTFTCFDRSGDQLPNSPEWTETLAYEHTFHVGGSRLSVSGNALFVSGTDTDVNIANNNGLDQYQPAYQMYGARLEYSPEDGNWSVGLFGNNLSNEAVRQRSFTSNRLWLMSPRTYGLTITARF